MSAKVTLTCDNCGKQIWKWRSQMENRGTKNHFCSRECANQFRQNGEYIICELCGKEVYRPKGKLNRGEHNYCSGECQRKALRRGEMIPCETCGKVVYKEAWRLDTYEHHYCSLECFGKANVTGEYCVCTNCGKEIYKPRCRMDEYDTFFCSEECRLSYARTGEYVVCVICGEEIYRSKSYLNINNSRYCSPECRAIGIRTGKHIECEYCGKEIWISPSMDGRKFCSRACYFRSGAETSLESNVKEALNAMYLNFDDQVPKGRYTLDFLLYPMNIAVEADGDYWHQDAERDIRRDKALLKRYGIPTVRIKENEVTGINKTCTILARRLWEVQSRIM